MSDGNRGVGDVSQVLCYGCLARKTGNIYGEGGLAEFHCNHFSHAISSFIPVGKPSCNPLLSLAMFVTMFVYIKSPFAEGQKEARDNSAGCCFQELTALSTGSMQLSLASSACTCWVISATDLGSFRNSCNRDPYFFDYNARPLKLLQCHL